MATGHSGESGGGGKGGGGRLLLALDRISALSPQVSLEL